MGKGRNKIPTKIKEMQKTVEKHQQEKRQHVNTKKR